MAIKWDGHQRGQCGIAHACASGPSEELATIWSKPNDYRPDDPTATLEKDIGRNIPAMHHAIRGRQEDLEWLVELHRLELERGLCGRDLMSPLYGGDNLMVAILTWHRLPDLGLEWQSAALDLRRWIRAYVTIAALSSAPQRVTHATWQQPPEGAVEYPAGEKWHQGPSVLRAGSRVNAQCALQEPVSDLLCAAIEWPGWRDTRLERRIDDAEAQFHDEAVALVYPGKPNAVGLEFQPSYLDPAVALSLLASRLNLSLAETCGLTEEERYALRHIVDGDEEEASYAVYNYLGRIPCHPAFKAIHFLRDEQSVAVVIEHSASRNKPTATVSVAEWSAERCRMTTLVPSRFKGTGATDCYSVINEGTTPLNPGSVDTHGDMDYWHTEIPTGAKNIWHYVWTAEGIRAAKGGDATAGRPDRQTPVDEGGGDPPPSPPSKPPKPQPSPSWWRRMINWLRSR